MEGRQGCSPPWSQPLSREGEGALVCSTQRCTAAVWAVQLHPVLPSLGRKKKQVGVQRVHNGNQMLKQQVTGKQNKGSLGRVFWQLEVSLTVPHGCCCGIRISNDLREQAGCKQQEERCIHGVSEVMAEWWLFRELLQLK